METKEKPKPTPDYLMQLMNDKKLMSSLPNFCGIFNHLERLLDEGQSSIYVFHSWLGFVRTVDAFGFILNMSVFLFFSFLFVVAKQAPEFVNNILRFVSIPVKYNFSCSYIIMPVGGDKCESFSMSEFESFTHWFAVNIQPLRTETMLMILY